MQKRVRKLRKGRCLALFSVLSLLLALSFGSLNAQATDAQNQRLLQPVTVQSGDTLWQLVDEHYQFRGDIRRAISEVEDINHITNASIQPGQVIYIPLN